MQLNSIKAGRRGEARQAARRRHRLGLGKTAGRATRARSPAPGVGRLRRRPDAAAAPPAKRGFKSTTLRFANAEIRLSDLERLTACGSRRPDCAQAGRAPCPSWCEDGEGHRLRHAEGGRARAASRRRGAKAAIEAAGGSVAGRVQGRKASVATNANQLKPRAAGSACVAG